MSQQKRPGGGSSSGGSGRPPSPQSRPGSGSRPTQQNRPATGSRPAQQGSSNRANVVRQPVGRGGRPQQRGSRVDQALPPFSGRRYLVIWAGFVALLVVVLLILLLLNNNNSGGGTASSGAGNSSLKCKGKCMIIDTAKGVIAAQLLTDPSAGVSKTVANFEDKANKGYFNGLNFHRVEDWVIQGGDPKGDGTGGGQMPSEYNQIPFKTGALGVARGGDPKINNDSQFFIVKKDSDFLNGQYTNFGQVTDGMDVVNKIAIGDKINKITIEQR